jgi:hypothetical protein
VLDLLWGGVDLLLALLGTSAETEDEMKGRLLLDIVVRESAAIFELLAGKDQALLVRGNAFLVLDFGFDIVDCIRTFNLKGDSLAREGLDDYFMLKSDLRLGGESENLQICMTA